VIGAGFATANPTGGAAGDAVGGGVWPFRASNPMVPRNPDVASPVVMTLAADAGCRRRASRAMR
jgi:hypothetical protein